MPLHLESEISQSSITQPFDQCGPTIPPEMLSAAPIVSLPDGLQTRNRNIANSLL